MVLAKIWQRQRVTLTRFIFVFSRKPQHHKMPGNVTLLSANVTKCLATSHMPGNVTKSLATSQYVWRHRMPDNVTQCVARLCFGLQMTSWCRLKQWGYKHQTAGVLYYHVSENDFILSIEAVLVVRIHPTNNSSGLFSFFVSNIKFACGWSGHHHSQC